MAADLPNARQKLAGLARQLGRFLGASRSVRSPKKQEAFRVLKERGVCIDAVVDVGVLHGTSELIHHFPNVHHYLFEPVDECREAIRQAYAGLSFTLIQKAVGEGDRVASMRILGEAGSLDSSAHVRPESIGHDLRDVDVVSLDSMSAQLDHIQDCLLKIDTDGNEVSVLEGAGCFLSKCAIVVVEVTQDNMADVVSRMSGHGFSIFDIVEPCYFDEALWQVDIIFLRRRDHIEKFDIISDNNFDKSKYTIYK